MQNEYSVGNRWFCVLLSGNDAAKQKRGWEGGEEKVFIPSGLPAPP